MIRQKQFGVKNVRSGFLGGGIIYPLLCNSSAGLVSSRRSSITAPINSPSHSAARSILFFIYHQVHTLLKTPSFSQTPPSSFLTSAQHGIANHVPHPPASIPYGAQSIYIPLLHHTAGLISFGFSSLQSTL